MKVQAMTRIEEDIKVAAEAQAARERRTFSNLLAGALEMYLQSVGAMPATGPTDPVRDASKKAPQKPVRKPKK